MRGEAVNMPNSQKLAKAAHSLSAEALGLDEFETLSREKAYLADAFGVPVEIYSADEAGEDPKGKSRRRSLREPHIGTVYMNKSKK